MEVAYSSSDKPNSLPRYIRNYVCKKLVNAHAVDYIQIFCKFIKYCGKLDQFTIRANFLSVVNLSQCQHICHEIFFNEIRCWSLFMAIIDSVSQ
jgi:hypothetical protein